jgi:hypothetical protein
VDIRFPLEEPVGTGEAPGFRATLVGNNDGGWNPVGRIVYRQSMTVSPSSAGGFSTWAIAFELQLEIEPLPGGLVCLSWPEPADQQVMESLSDLGASDAWVEVGVTPMLNDDRGEVPLIKA